MQPLRVEHASFSKTSNGDENLSISLNTRVKLRDPCRRVPRNPGKRVDFFARESFPSHTRARRVYRFYSRSAPRLAAGGGERGWPRLFLEIARRARSRRQPRRLHLVIPTPSRISAEGASDYRALETSARTLDASRGEQRRHAYRAIWRLHAFLCN